MVNWRKVRLWFWLYVAFDLFFGGICGGFIDLTPAAAAQFTTVTGTVIDPNGVPYANGTITATLITSASPTLSGLPYTPPTQQVGLSSAGAFVMQLADNTQLSPGGTQWTFKVCSAAGTVLPAGGVGPVCFVAGPVTISGSSQNLTATLAGAAVALSIPIIPSLPQGTQLFSLGHAWMPSGTPVANTLQMATTAIWGAKIVILTPVSVRFATLSLGTAVAGNTISVALVSANLSTVLVQWDNFAVGSGSGNKTVDNGSYVTIAPGVYYFVFSETFAASHASISCSVLGGDAGAAASVLNANSSHGLVFFNQTTSAGVITAPLTISSDDSAATRVPVVMFN